MARFVRNKGAEYGKSVWTRGRLSTSFDVSDEVGDAMLKAQAEILAEEQRKNAGTMLNVEGYGKGYTKDSIQVSKPYSRGGARLIQIRFFGTRPDGKRAAEIAFYNEFGIGDSYGYAKIPARGFIAKANADKEDEAMAAAEDILEAYTESELYKGL